MIAVFRVYFIRKIFVRRFISSVDSKSRENLENVGWFFTHTHTKKNTSTSLTLGVKDKLESHTSRWYVFAGNLVLSKSQCLGILSGVILHCVGLSHTLQEV